MRKISSLFYVIQQGFLNIWHNKLYSLASVATIAACLFLFGVFYAIVANFQHIVMKAEEGVSVTVFFHDEYDLCYRTNGILHREEYVHPEGQIPSEQRMEDIGRMILARAEVSEVKFISDEEAWATFGPQYFGEDYASGYEENPLRGENTYEAYLSDVSMQEALVNWLNTIPEIRKINYDESTASTLTGANLLIAYISVGIIGILLAVSVFLISNTVAMGIAVRSEEINIMKYVGATDLFVRAPFVIEGMLIGLMGAGLPLLALYHMYEYAMNYLTTNFMMLSSLLDFLKIETVFDFLTPISLLLGVGIGFFGSMSSVRKHLNV